MPNPAKFTHELPKGWTQDVAGVTSREARWKGWSISTIREWTWTAGTEKRHYFTQGHDQMAIIDSQQQRLAPRDAMNAEMVCAWYQNDFEDTQAISDVLSKYNDLILFTSPDRSGSVIA